jgi:hypothetical protein
VLFLRSFELEAYEFHTGGDWTAETHLPAHTVSMSNAGPSSVERQLVDAFPEPPVVLAVANRLSLFESSWSTPRLFLPDEGWKDVIAVLVRAASVTVMQIETLSPGVHWELEQIDAYGAPDRTLIVCLGQDEDSLALMSGLRRFAGLPAIDRPPVRPANAALSRFPHVVPWEEIPPEGIAAVPPLPDLLAGVQSFRELEPEARLRLLLELDSEPPDAGGPAPMG